MIVFGVQYANGGLKFLLTLALQDLFKNYYHLEPTQTQLFITIIWMPMSLKFICGVIADSVPLFGSRKKNWIIFWACVQTVALSICATIKIDSCTHLVVLIFLAVFG